MKAKGKFISFLLVVDTFFVAYAYGFHSRQVLVVDPKLPPVVLKKDVQKKEGQKKEGQKKVIEKTESPKNPNNHKNIKGAGQAPASAANAGAAALTKKHVLKQSPAKDKTSGKSTSTKPAAKKSFKNATGPAAKAKDP
jgi:hypothetical protein